MYRKDVRVLTRTRDHYAADSHLVVRSRAEVPGSTTIADEVTLAIRRVIPSNGIEELQIEIDIFKPGKKRATRVCATFTAPAEIADQIGLACTTLRKPQA